MAQLGTAPLSDETATLALLFERANNVAILTFLERRMKPTEFTSVTYEHFYRKVIQAKVAAEVDLGHLLAEIEARG